MATPKKKQRAQASQSRRTQSKENAQKKAIPDETTGQSHRLSEVRHEQPRRESTMAEDMNKTAEEMQKTGKQTAEDMKRTGEEFTKAAREFDVKGMSKIWKQGYLGGLEALYQSQELNARLLKETVKQGISGFQQMFQVYEKWLEQIQGQTGPASPFVEWSRQAVRAFHNNADPFFKTAADTAENAFNYYENALARPSRQHALDLHAKVIDTVISANGAFKRE
jgi:prophage DNA circulation protein